MFWLFIIYWTMLCFSLRKTIALWCQLKGRTTVVIFTGFACAADLFFWFVYDLLIDFNCFSIGSVALHRFSIDLHWLLEIFVDFQFVCWLLKIFYDFMHMLIDFRWKYIDLHRCACIFRDSYWFSLIFIDSHWFS